MLITDQVATAPCTDPIQVAIPAFAQKVRIVLEHGQYHPLPQVVLTVSNRNSRLCVQSNAKN